MYFHYMGLGPYLCNILYNLYIICFLVVLNNTQEFINMSIHLMINTNRTILMITILDQTKIRAQTHKTQA